MTEGPGRHYVTFRCGQTVHPDQEPYEHLKCRSCCIHAIALVKPCCRRICLHRRVHVCSSLWDKPSCLMRIPINFFNSCDKRLYTVASHPTLQGPSRRTPLTPLLNLMYASRALKNDAYMVSVRPLRITVPAWHRQLPLKVQRPLRARDSF